MEERRSGGTRAPTAGGIARWENCKWVVGDLEPGIYPIKPWARRWFLNAKRKFPILPIHRTQLPLAPAFAITAHGAQGQTLRAAIVDLQIGTGVSIIASYVAITRVRRREDILIFREFDRQLFTGGAPVGASLLIRVLHKDPRWTSTNQGLTYIKFPFVKNQ